MSRYGAGGAIGLVCGLAFAAQARAAEAPEARTGFQMGVRAGYSQPMGRALEDTHDEPRVPNDFDISDVFSQQGSLIFDIGSKVTPEIFLGGYLGLAFGLGGHTMPTTDHASRLNVGIEGQYHFLPEGSVNPWLGYGLGIETARVAGTEGLGEHTLNLTGWEFARIMGGADFRVSRVVGVGPFVDFSLGGYQTLTFKSPGTSEVMDLDSSALHEWLTVGARVVFLP